MTSYLDEWGRHYGYCNACGEEAPLDGECCVSGEVVQFEDDEDEF